MDARVENARLSCTAYVSLRADNYLCVYLYLYRNADFCVFINANGR